jgi:hypothetical protein
MTLPMPLLGEHLVATPAGRTFLKDLHARPDDAPAGIENALARVTELPVGDWYPRGTTDTDEAALWGAVVDVYCRGITAAVLVADRAAGTPTFYRADDWNVDGRRIEFLAHQPSSGLLAAAHNAVGAARTVLAGVELMRPARYGGVLPIHLDRVTALETFLAHHVLGKVQQGLFNLRDQDGGASRGA